MTGGERKERDDRVCSTLPAQLEGLDHIFRRHVRPKKQHEVKVLGEVSAVGYSSSESDMWSVCVCVCVCVCVQVVQRLSEQTNCRNIIVSYPKLITKDTSLMRTPL